MDKLIAIKINNKEIQTISGRTILDVARENGIDIPTLCQHPDLPARASCRVCVVKVKGAAGLKTACSTTIWEGMEIETDSPEIEQTRRTNLELIFAQHIEECGDCIWRYNCQLLDLAKKHQVKIARFPDRKKKCPLYQFGPAYIFDGTKCIDCRNCVEACDRQKIGFYEVEGRGADIAVVPSADERKECIYCGQCVVHCPVGAFEAVGEFEDIEKPLLDKGKMVVVQIAPSVRASIGEEFGLPPGENVAGRLVAAIRQAGFNKVFDTSLGADFTTVEEAKELLERIDDGNLPMFTSCCPGWVRYAEFYLPELLPRLTTVRSPHMILGGLVKTYWAEKEKINPKDIVAVSVMPCIAKKYEATRPEFKIDGLNPVDYVMTVRELAFLLKKKNIDLKNIKPEDFDDPLGSASGAGVIYGASGGVMESALRTAKSLDCPQDSCPPLELRAVRGTVGLKKTQIQIGNRTVRAAVASGIDNALKIIAELKADPRAYDYVEIMACPGGCVGGGGQPVPTSGEICRQRAAGLYAIDAEKGGKKESRLAHENPAVKNIYKDYLTDEGKIRPVCHTSYSQKKKGMVNKYFLNK